jgi:modulator of FtsH protease
MQLVSNTTSDNLQKLGKTYSYVFNGVLLAMLGSWAILPYTHVLTAVTFFILILLEFLILFWFIFKKVPVAYYLFTLFTGITLVPTLNHFISIGSSDVIIQSLTLTTFITGGLTLYASTTRKNFLTMGTYLFWVLIGMLLLMVINIFIGSSLLSLYISYCVAIMFSFYMIYDTQRVLYTDVTPIEAAMDLYLNILNLFSSLLNITSNFKL